MIEIPKSGLRQFIREMASRHGIDPAPTQREQFALDVTERAAMFDRCIKEK